MLENLKALRERAKITQKQLADAIGVSQQSINKYENHNIEPDIQTLIKIAEYFNTSVDYLIGHTDHPADNRSLTTEEASLLKAYKGLSRKQQLCIKTIIDSYQ